MKRIEVAVGIVFNSDNDVLIGQRLVKDAYYQKWEFPGGKLEDKETAQQALVRELQEELGIVVEKCELLMEHKHDYPDSQVTLFVYTIAEYSGNALGKEGQALRWVNLNELSNLNFLQGNQSIIEKLLASR